jgi:hypothetical protein
MTPAANVIATDAAVAGGRSASAALPSSPAMRGKRTFNE